MKKIFLFLLVAYIACTSPAKQAEQPAPGPVAFSAQMGGISYHDSMTSIFVKTTLHNNTNDTVMYLRMTCSWREAFTTDNDSFRVLYIPCFQNGPLTVKIPPHQSEDEYLQVNTKINTYHLREQRFRVGFNYAPYDTTMDEYGNFERLNDMKNILWSDTLKVSVFWKN